MSLFVIGVAVVVVDPSRYARPNDSLVVVVAAVAVVVVDVFFGFLVPTVETDVVVPVVLPIVAVECQTR